MTPLDPARVLIVANRTAPTPALVEAIRARVRRGPAAFHLVVPAMPRGLHRVVDPEIAGREEVRANLEVALPRLSAAAGHEISGEVGDASPVAAIADAMYGTGFDEIIVSTLPSRLSRWIKMDLPNQPRSFGVPVTHVHPEAVDACAVELSADRLALQPL